MKIVHVVPHSHCDPGWIKTFDEYYDTGVKFILNSVLDNLFQHPDRKFIWAETSFFHRWWTTTATKQQQDNFRTVLNRGQLEFVNGGWVMHDEAVTTYGSDITQTTVGHQYLVNLFGERGKVRVGWSIDPFGLSKATAAMNKEFGYDYYVINRIPMNDRASRRSKKEMEFLWKDEVSDKSLFTHILYEHYGSYPGFHYEPIIGGYSPPVTSENVQERSETLADVILNKFAPSYKTDHILFPYGDDMNYQNSSINFNNMTLIMEHINAKSDQFGIKLVWSTLSEYFDSVKDSQNNWPVYTGEFFPYQDATDSYWTGYFTSRPALKDLARIGERYARSAETLYSLSQIQSPGVMQSTDYDQLFPLRSANGLVQHHDAITGTESEGALQDYEKRINDGISILQSVFSKSISALLSLDKKVVFTTNAPDYLLSIQPSRSIPIVLFNSLAWPRTQLVTVVVPKGQYSVREVDSQEYTVQQDELGDGRMELSFQVKCNALSLTRLIITRKSSLPITCSPSHHDDNQNLSVQLDDQFNIVSLIKGDQKIPIQHSIAYYVPNIQVDDGPVSNPYVFRPIRKDPLLVTSKPTLRTVRGPLFDAYTSNRPTIQQTIRILKNQPTPYIDLNYRIGTLDPNQELIIKMNVVGKSNHGKWSTDSNTWRQVERIRTGEPFNDTKKSWPISSNYYPVQYSAGVNFDGLDFTFLLNSSRGCSSITDDSIEFMLHRRLTNLTGWNIPLDDKAVSYVSMRLGVDVAGDDKRRVSKDALEQNFPVDVFYVQNMDDAKSVMRAKSTQSLISCDVPQDVHLQSLEPHFMAGRGERTLMRWRNLSQDKQEQAKDINMSSCFKSFKEYKETSLSATRELKSENGSEDNLKLSSSQTRTFVCAQ